MSSAVWKWKRRAAVVAAMAGGLIGVGFAGAAFAAVVPTLPDVTGVPQFPATPSPGQPGPWPQAWQPDHNFSTAAGEDAAPPVPAVWVSKSEVTHQNGQLHGSWSLLTVGDINVLGRDHNGWTGTLAFVGPTIDAANAQTCPAHKAIDARTSVNGCVFVAPAGASRDDSSSASASGSAAEGYAYIKQDNRFYGFTVDLLDAESSESYTNQSCWSVEGYADLAQVFLQTGSDSTSRAKVLAPVSQQQGTGPSSWC